MDIGKEVGVTREAGLSASSSDLWMPGSWRWVDDCLIERNRVWEGVIVTSHIYHEPLSTPPSNVRHGD